MSYTEDIDSAYETIKEDGAEITITQTAFNGSNYDPETDSDGGTPATDDTYAVKLNYKMEQIDNTNIIMGDVLFLIPAKNLTLIIKPGDLLTFVSEDYRVINSLPLEPDGIPILYKVQARK